MKKTNFRQYRIWLLVLLFTLIGFGLRIYRLAEVPSELHRDEAAIGYNAYSLLKTGLDEHGRGPWPLIFESFGDYKLPGLIYTTVASFKVLGVSEFSLRLPNVLLATLLIPVVGLVMWELTRKESYALASSGLLSISIWHTFLARTVYEPVAGLTLHTLALYFWLKARKHPAWFIPSLLFFILSFFTYNLPLLLAPLMVVVTTKIFWSEYRQHRDATIMAGAAFTLIVICTWGVLSQLSGGKAKATIFGDEQLISEQKIAFDAMIQARVPYRVVKVVNNPIGYLGWKFTHGYIAAFDPNYLFFKGGQNPWHSLGLIGVGNVNLAHLGLVLVALATWLRRGRQDIRWRWWVIAYLLISPLPDALTNDAPNTNRLLDFHLALELVAAMGIVELWQLRERKKVLYSSLLILAMGVFAWQRFMIRYHFIHDTNMDPLWHEGIKEVGQYLRQSRSQYDHVFIDMNHAPGHSLAYIYILWYTQLDPALFHRTAVWSTDTAFVATHQFDLYHFRDIEDVVGTKALDLLKPNYKKVLIVNKIQDQKSHKEAIKIIYDTQGKPIWELIEVQEKPVLLAH